MGCLACSDVKPKKVNFLRVFCFFCCFLFMFTSGHSTFEKSSMYSERTGGLWETLTDLSEEAHSYVVHLVGARTLKAVQKSLSQVVWTVAGGLASALTVTSQYLTQLLRAAGVEVDLHLDHITPESVVNIGQWVLLALIGYWLLSMALRLVASTLRRVLWLLKLSAVLGLFGLILSDSDAETQTTALRLAGLGCLCILLGIGQPGAGSAVKTAHLEEQVRALERRVREMERRRIEE
ncbi:voltage-gated monoatomic cation channel TMEM109 [Osmerus eperlanus]|uniref:voltage-gated monoatomic cation channel TMEM109 n=1 Tax=Osmerus eperlanus TaxID=29151 RepID=UPI002E131A7D